MFISSVSAANYTVTGNNDLDYGNAKNWLSNVAQDNDELVFDINECHNWSFNIDKSIKIKSNKNTKFIGNGTGTAFNITVNKVFLSGFQFLNYDNAITSNGTGLTITDNLFQSNNYGIYFETYAFENNIIKNNTLRDNYMGMWLYAVYQYHSYTQGHSMNNTIINNQCYDNIQYGICLYSMNSLINNTISNNIVIGSDTGIYIRSSRNSTINNTISNNIVNNNDYAGIFIISGSEGTKCSIINNTIYNNTCNNNQDGIHLLADGLEVINNTLEKNTVINNTENGLYLEAWPYSSSDGGNITKNLLKNNHIEDNKNGIHLTGMIVEDNNVIGSKIINNTNGIFMIGLNRDNKVIGNDILNNIIGILLNNEYYLQGGNVSNLNISYNRIYKNNQSVVIYCENAENNTAELNWWGNNTPNLNITGINPVKIWYVLRLSADEVNTTANYTKNYTNRYNTSLKYELSTNIPVNHDPSQLPEFLVTIIGPNGETTTADIRNTTLNYFVEGKGLHSIQALSDDENIKLTVSFPNKTEPPIPPTPEPIPDPTPNPIPNPTSNPDPNLTNNNPSNIPNTNAAMKATGVPIVVLVLVLLSSLGLVFRKN